MPTRRNFEYLEKNGVFKFFKSLTIQLIPRSTDYVTKAVYQRRFKRVPPVATTKNVEKTTDV